MASAQPSAFGGPANMPTAEKLAINGLRYNRFHATALCAPTRMARQMEVFAGFGKHTDHKVGRLVDAIAGMCEMDNTLLIYILVYNGAGAEGGMVGLFNEMNYFNQAPEQLEDILKRIDDLGGRAAYNHCAAGWAVAGDTKERDNRFTGRFSKVTVEAKL